MAEEEIEDNLNLLVKRQELSVWKENNKFIEYEISLLYNHKALRFLK
jgi:hypothetical protein